MALRAVTFDLWETLLHDPTEQWQARKLRRIEEMGRLLRAWGHPYKSEQLLAAYERARTTWNAARALTVELSHRQKMASFVAAVDPTLATTLDPDHLEELALEHARIFFLLPPQVLPGAREAVRSFNEQGIRLGLISNTGDTPGFAIRRFLHQVGIGNRFSAFTFSDELGLGKPARAAFLLTLRRLGVEPHEAVHIGDHPELDLLGAKRAGMRMIMIPPQELPPHLPRPDAQIGGLWEAPAAVAALHWDEFIEPPAPPLVR